MGTNYECWIRGGFIAQEERRNKYEHRRRDGWSVSAGENKDKYDGGGGEG